MKRILTTIAAGAWLLVTSGAAPAPATQPQQPQATYNDIQQTLGSVPSFFRDVPAAALPGAWTEFKEFQLNPNTALPNKTKELIGLAVAAQIPCRYCVYFHTQAARAAGATDAEIQSAVTMAAVTRHWSTILNGNSLDEATFDREVDQVMAHAQATNPSH